jgi:hypothetical protein
MWFCLCLVLAVDGEEAGEPHAGHQEAEARPQQRLRGRNLPIYLSCSSPRWCGARVGFILVFV